MARDATTRLYDVDQHRTVLKRLFDKEKYDHAEIFFRARRGKLIELDRLYESLWATRLSGGTRSGVVSLVVTIEGDVVVEDKQSILRSPGSERRFILVSESEAKGEKAQKTKLEEMREVIGNGAKVIRVTGRIDGWRGKWPEVLKKPFSNSVRILVTGFETASEKDTP